MNKALVFLALSLLCSCTTIQLANKAAPLSAASLLTQCQQHSNPIEWVSAQLNGTATFNQQSLPLNAQLRLRKDSVLWLSFRALMGIEVARVLLSPDSIKLINRLNTSYFVGTIEDLADSYQLPFSYEQLQDVLLARLSFNPKDFSRVVYDEQGYALYASKNDSLPHYRLNANFLPTDIMQSRSDSQHLIISYPDYQQLDSLWVPKELYLQAQSDTKKVMATFRFSKTSINKPKKVKFSIPSSYVPM